MEIKTPRHLEVWILLDASFVVESSPKFSNIFGNLVNHKSSFLPYDLLELVEEGAFLLDCSIRNSCL